MIPEEIKKKIEDESEKRYSTSYIPQMEKINQNQAIAYHIAKQQGFKSGAEFGYSLATEQQEKELERKGMVIVSKLAWEQLQASKTRIKELEDGLREVIRYVPHKFPMVVFNAKLLIDKF